MTANDIKKSLISQLSAKKAATPFFLNLVDEYINLYRKLKKIQTAINKKGLEIEEIFNTNGDKRTKPNPLLKEERDTIKQMLAILDKLKLNVDTVVDENEEDEL